MVRPIAANSGVAAAKSGTAYRTAAPPPPLLITASTCVCACSAGAGAHVSVPAEIAETAAAIHQFFLALDLSGIMRSSLVVEREAHGQRLIGELTWEGREPGDRHCSAGGLIEQSHPTRLMDGRRRNASIAANSEPDDGRAWTAEILVPAVFDSPQDDLDVLVATEVADFNG